MKKLFLLIVTVAMAAGLCGCTKVNMQPKTPAEWRAYLQFRRNQVLHELYAVAPQAKAEIARAKGYGVFVNLNVNLILASFTGGRGVIHENGPLGGKDTFMRMAQGGLGLGWGAKDFRTVLIFEDRQALVNFLNNKWQFGAEADAAAKGGDTGKAVSGAVGVAPGLRVYQLTESGLALQATVHGTRFWRDEFVNEDTVANKRN
ncbi:MAG TPA: YSC84-related protein [Patescibacteria group bacterium]|nr:YSC84-related protein [Patescibacteria group bacterium]